MKKIIILFILLNCLSCINKPKTKKYDLIQKAHWFIGNWKNETEENSFLEIWKKQSDSTFIGKSFALTKNDTVFEETMQLKQHNDSLFYNVSVKGEDETSFYLTKSSGNELVFENPKHDFPTKIVYKKITTDSIVATIYGKINSEFKSKTFPLERLK